MRVATFTAFDVETVAFDALVELRLAGELDVDTAGHFRRAFDEAYEQGADTVVVDLAGLRFIDSTGLHELIVARRRQHNRGGELVLRAPTAQTRRVLAIVGFDRVFTIT